LHRSAGASLPRTVRPGVDREPAARGHEPGVDDGGPGGALALVLDGGVGQADQGDLGQDARVEVGLTLDDRAPPEGGDRPAPNPCPPRRSGQAVDFRELGVSPKERSAWHD